MILSSLTASASALSLSCTLFSKAGRSVNGLRKGCDFGVNSQLKLQENFPILQTRR